MNTKHSLFRNPSCLLYNQALSYSARWVGAALYSRRNHLGQCTISLDALAKLASCSVPTARKATEELKRAGCIDFCRSYQYQEKIGRVGYGKTTYACLLPVTEDYTLIPREIFQWKLSHGAFCVCLCLFQQAGNNKKAFPSIRSIAKLLEMGCSTVCRALGAIRKLQGIIVLRCKNRNCTFNRNSYYLRVEYKGVVQTSVTDSVPHKGDSCSFFFSHSTAVHSQTQSLSDHGGAPIFYRQLRDLDNDRSYKRRKNYRAGDLSLEQGMLVNDTRFRHFGGSIKKAVSKSYDSGTAFVSDTWW
ncbi:helix-turn-helix domain-containing protein [Oscillibacter ruminantium]|uniref:helix-turn-helix domain-containing protein n=1 Tax=Oscillibacter ruminantium TaxID=1263547 RepID=UPI0002FB19BC|nr:helix-turn-helix domain-containing protein [Oscillibacter ruminantium]